MPYFTETQLAMREGIRRMVDKSLSPSLPLSLSPPLYLHHPP